MHSVRRAVFRAASSSSSLTAVASKGQLASFAMQFSKAGVRQAAAIPAARYFSQTSRVAQEEGKSGTDAGEVPTLTSSPTEPQRNREGHPVFVSNMTFDATDMHLREAFNKFGDILSVSIGRDGRGLSRGFGFVTFASEDAAKRAIAETHQTFWHGRRLNVELQKQSDRSSLEGRTRTPPANSSHEPTTSIYIGNIPYETSDADLNRLFRTLENVIDVRVAVDRNTGWPRGFAHADFTDIESAKRAYEKLSTTALGGRQLRVDYSVKRNNAWNREGRD